MQQTFKILTLNNISVAGLERLPRDRYEVASELPNPDAILVRSYKMHDHILAPSVKAVARAGAGVNNIPIARMSEVGVPVFNSPGANANAVKELVIAAMLLGARNVCSAWDFARTLEGTDAEINAAVESGKKNFVGFELPGRTLGVIGLGAIGVQVANAALSLGMRVHGYDPGVTVERAWQLSSAVYQATSVGELLARADVVSLHVPLVDKTKHLINAERISSMRKGALLLNFARQGIADDDAVVAALSEGHLHGYVCDFPTRLLQRHPRVIALPHLGASTREAEENCAVMVADQLRDYLEHGNISNSVNFPEVSMPRASGAARIALVNANVPSMIGQISTTLAEAGLNIVDLLNKSRGDVAYTLVDVDGEVDVPLIQKLRAISGILSVRDLGHA